MNPYADYQIAVQKQRELEAQFAGGALSSSDRPLGARFAALVSRVARKG